MGVKNMTDGPYPFSGKIIEAYYTNPELDTVSIIWSDGKKAREYCVVVDEEDHQFQALLSEFSYENLDEWTMKRNVAGRQEFKDAFKHYAERTKMFVGSEERQGSLNLLFNFDSENTIHKEGLFKLKLKIFEQDVVKDSGSDDKFKNAKTFIRKVDNPMDALLGYMVFTNGAELKLSDGDKFDVEGVYIPIK